MFRGVLRGVLLPSFDAAVEAGQGTLPQNVRLLRLLSERVFYGAAAKEITEGLSVNQISRRVAAILARVPANALRKGGAGELRRLFKRKRDPESFRELHALWAHHDIPGNAKRFPFKPELIEGHIALLRGPL